jgi:MFS family permease
LTSKLLPAAERILLTLWVGALWVAGFIVAPLLFTELDDRALAGSLAGSLFTITSYLGLCCGGVLLLFNGLGHRAVNWRAVVIVGMLLLVVIGQFVITPMVVELRDAGLTETPRFGQLHGMASVLFIGTSLLGLMLVAAGEGNRR